MKRPRSFTLMELLIAVSIFAVIALCLYSVFACGIRIWRRQEVGFKYNQTLRLALDSLAKELKNSIIYSQPQKGDGEVLPVFTGSASSLSFFGLIGGNIAKVGYTFENIEGQKGELKRRIVFQKDGFREDAQKEEALISNVDNISFEYAYEDAAAKDGAPTWRGEWSKTDQIPRGVRIGLEIKDDQGRAEILKKTVFIPMGALGKE